MTTDISQAIHEVTVRKAPLTSAVPQHKSHAQHEQDIARSQGASAYRRGEPCEVPPGHVHSPDLADAWLDGWRGAERKAQLDQPATNRIDSLCKRFLVEQRMQTIESAAFAHVHGGPAPMLTADDRRACNHLMAAATTHSLAAWDAHDISADGPVLQ